MVEAPTIAVASCPASAMRSRRLSTARRSVIMAVYKCRWRSPRKSPRSKARISCASSFLVRTLNRYMRRRSRSACL